MRRLIAPLAVLGLAGALVLTGCAKKEEPIGTSTDSTLSLGDLPNEASPAPEGTYSTTTTTTTTTPPKASPPPRTTPRPRPTPRPAPEPTGTVVPAGTALAMTMDTEVSTKDKVVGDTFNATLAHDVVVDGKVVFPAGSTVSGHVAEAERPGKTSGRGRMVLSYDSISANGRTYAIDTMGPAIEGKSGTAGDATKIVGGAAAGAILGKILGGKAGTGAAIGAAAGTGAALATRGPDPVVKAGATVNVSLDRSVTVR
ncbi:MAG: hypothetical protein ABI960_09335 [Candidatus Eisenbacteria bacterium]